MYNIVKNTELWSKGYILWSEIPNFRARGAYYGQQYRIWEQGCILWSEIQNFGARGIYYGQKYRILEQGVYIMVKNIIILKSELYTYSGRKYNFFSKG